jgi:hypothetical protein
MTAGGVWEWFSGGVGGYTRSLKKKMDRRKWRGEREMMVVYIYLMSISLFFFPFSKSAQVVLSRRGGIW